MDFISRGACLSAVLFAGFSNAQETTTVRNILVRFYETCNGDSWHRNNNWMDDDASVCTWFGTTCDDDENLVQLELQDNNLKCTIPDEVFYLPSLEVFDVSGNSDVSVGFKGIDPDAAADLEQLYLKDTLVESLDGIEVFSSLEALGANGVALTGDFPSQLFLLTDLTALDLSDNFLSGTIPNEIQTLNNLRFLLLSHNLLTGTLSNSIGGLKDLSQLLIAYNDLTGTLPAELTQLDRLTFLALNDQTMEEGGGLTGPMLDFASAPTLLSVDVANNGLTGVVPGNLLKSVDPGFSNLINVDMSGNHFTGVVPAELSRFQALRLYLSGNSIQGIDSNLCSQDGWFFGDVGEFGCDGILCPPGSFNVFGRQISTGFPCESCTQSSYFGATKCDPEAPQISDGSSRHSRDPQGSNVFETEGGSASSDVVDNDARLHHDTIFSVEEDDGDEVTAGAAVSGLKLNFDFLGILGSPEGDSSTGAKSTGSMLIERTTDETTETGIQTRAVTSEARTPLSRTIFLLCCIGSVMSQW